MSDARAKAEAAAAFSGYYAACIEGARCRNEIGVVVAALRAEGLYRFSDALRDIVNRLDLAVTYPCPELSREGFPDITGDFQNKYCGGGGSVTMRGDSQ